MWFKKNSVKLRVLRVSVVKIEKKLCAYVV
jgi:hypothetical protein